MKLFLLQPAHAVPAVPYLGSPHDGRGLEPHPSKLVVIRKVVPAAARP